MTDPTVMSGLASLCSYGELRSDVWNCQIYVQASAVRCSRWKTKGVQEDYGTAENEKGLALVKALTLQISGAGCRTRTRHPMITKANRQPAKLLFSKYFRIFLPDIPV